MTRPERICESAMARLGERSLQGLHGQQLSEQKRRMMSHS